MRSSILCPHTAIILQLEGEEAHAQSKPFARCLQLQKVTLTGWVENTPMKVDSKMSESCKGRVPWNKGKKGLQAAWNKGKKVGNDWLGRKHTDATRQKMSEATKGQTAWNKGKKGIYTDESLHRMSKARETSERISAREFFFSLPREMDIAEKRKHLRQRFPDVNHCKIWKWCKKFDSETQPTADA